MKTLRHISPCVFAFAGILCLAACSASEADAVETSRNTSNPSTAEPVLEMDGLFGVKFGKVMSKSDPCETNNVGELAYEYYPETLFRGYSDYILFATPITRQVSHIRAVCMIDEDEADDEIDATVKRLEAKFGKKSSKRGDTRYILFDNDDAILVNTEESLFGTKIYIDAICHRLHELYKKEVAQVEESSLARDIQTLNLLPKKTDGDDKVFRIESVFGVAFGETFAEGYNPKQNDHGAWAYKFNPNGPFVDCSDFLAFATAKTKKVFSVRAIFDGDDDSEATRHYDQIRRLVERVTGREFREGDAKGMNKSCSMLFGDVFVNLEKNWLADNVILDFVRISLFRLNDREREEEESAGMSEDLDAL